MTQAPHLSESVLGTTRKRLEEAHAASTLGASALGLLRPVNCKQETHENSEAGSILGAMLTSSHLLVRVAARGALALLDVVRALPASYAQSVRLGVTTTETEGTLCLQAGNTR